MSQFRVEKVTKVKGLSDLSEKAKVAEKEPTTKRTRGTANSHERPPSTQGRQTSVKKTSLPSKADTSSEASSSQSKGKPSVPQRSGAPKPAARTKPSTQNPKATANKVPAAKNCPSQQDRQSSATTTDAPATKKKSSGYGVTPAQRTRTSAVSKPSLQKAPRETNTNLKKKSEIKKENSYDASDSDSEKGSVDRLTTDGDFGYETGSYDDSDVSTGELLSPSAKDEQKSILNPNPGGSTTYSYAAIEGRPLLVTDEGGISSSIGDRGLKGRKSDSQLVVEQPTEGDRSSYTYAGDEFRPLIITEEGGVAGPVKGAKTPMNGGSDRAIGGGGFDSKDKPIPQRRVQVPMAYEEVEVFEGGYDRSNIKLTPSANERTNENSSVAPANDVYAVVQKKPKEISTAESTNNVLENSRNEASTSDQLYATVQKPPSQPQRANVELAEIPPSIPGTRKDSNMYEAITGELQNMIIACDEVPMDGKLSEADSNERKTSDGDKKVPPPMPKPYAGPGLSYVEQKEHLAENYLSDSEKEEDTEANLQPVYAIVQKKPKDKPVENKPTEENIHKPANDISMSAESLDEESQPVYAAVKKPAKPVYHRSLDSLDQLRIPITLGDDEDDEGDMPPPLPARPTDLGDTMKKTHSSEDVLKIKQTEEKPKKGGFNIFKKKHRRQLSDGNVASQIKTAVENGNLSSSATKGNGHGHRRSKSQADAADFIPAHRKIADSKDSYAEITIPPSKVRSPSDETPPVKPYLEVDIQTEPPSTPTELKKERRFMGGGTIGQSAPYELPDGWREVKSDSGTYYWHVASGTTQWDPPQVAPRLKKKLSDEGKPSPEITERQKVLSFPVHSMGWIELEESQVAPHNMSETISECISTLAQKRNDLWNTSETWGEGKDIRLLLEGDTLKLTEPRTKVTMLVQPVSKMRVWGVGKEDHRDFAYVARDPSTGKHKCHMFRCHGNISGRAITSALHEMCSKILEEKKKAQEIVKKTSPQKPWSDILNTPPPPSARDHASFNEKPHVESKKSFSAKYIGSIEVPKPTGVDTLNKAINKLTSKGGTWRTILIEISVSNIRITDCSTQELLSEDRVRFMSFFGVGKDERTCGYIVSTAPEVFVCHVFQCVPNAATLTKALAEACQLRFQKCIDAHPEIISKVGTVDLEKAKDKSDKDKDKAGFMTSVQGFLGKLGPKKGGGKKEEGGVQESKPVSSNRPVITCKPSHTFMVKYYGALPVAVGTGIETVEEAAKHLAGGTLLVCQLDVALNGVTLYDSQRSALSKRHFDADTISYCGLTSNRSHFGLIQSMGGGKYICHVFAEYKTKAGPIVAAIHETL